MRMHTSGEIVDLLLELELLDYSEYFDDKRFGDYRYSYASDTLNLNIVGYALTIELAKVLEQIKLSEVVRFLYKHFKFSNVSISFLYGYLFNIDSLSNCINEIIQMNNLKHFSLEVYEMSSDLITTIVFDETINTSSLVSLSISSNISVKFDDVRRLISIQALRIGLFDEESLQTVYNSYNLRYLMLDIENLGFVDKKKYEYVDYRLNQEGFEVEKKSKLEDLFIEYGAGPITKYRKIIENFDSVKNLILRSSKNTADYFSRDHWIIGLPRLLDEEDKSL